MDINDTLELIEELDKLKDVKCCASVGMAEKSRHIICQIIHLRNKCRKLEIMVKQIYTEEYIAASIKLAFTDKTNVIDTPLML